MPFNKKFNYKILLYILGLTISFLGFCFIPSIILAYIYKEPTLSAFLISSIISIIGGYILMFFNRKYPPTLTKKDGRIIVGLIWFLSPIIGAIPYLFSLNIFSSPLNAFFESFSGFTTTGSSIIKDLDIVPKSILLWRALTQWIGGLGLALMIIALIRNFRNGSNYLFNAEFTSLDKEKVHPHIKDTVFRIFYVYFGLTLIGIGLLWLGDMDWFTALCHSFGAVSTGGFTTVNGNIGQFSLYTQHVIMGLMFFSSISYVLIYWLFKGKWDKFFNDEQLKIFVLIIIIASILLFISLYFFKTGSLGQSLHNAVFHVISTVSTTGYILPEAENFGLFAFVVLIILMFIGGCSSSSSTGLKIIRVIILVKYTFVSFKRMFHPRAVIPIRYNKKALVDQATNLVFGFFFLYLLIFILGTFALTLTGNEFLPSIAMSAANLSNIGPVVGSISPQTEYFLLNPPSKAILIILMTIGRLEIYSFLAMFSRSIWMRN